MNTRTATRKAHLDYSRHPKNFVNCLTYSRFPYFDIKTERKGYKSRPILIIGYEKDKFPCDFNILPVSSITNESHRDMNYDIEIPEHVLSQISLLNRTSYIRTHKQSTVNSADISNNSKAVNIKDISSEFYEEVIAQHSEFTQHLFE